MAETDYKDTLNLPQTKFPMKANLAQREPQMLESWYAMDLYAKIQAKPTTETFILQDGPPFANGDIHIGHALNKILKDIICKSKVLSGIRAPYIPGWDCHGLPIEVIVEKKVGKVGDKISGEDFRIKCREYAAKQIDIQRDSFKRLGVFGDWDKPYLTMDFKYEANIIRTFGKIVNNGHLHSGDRPVHWCVHCGSSLAEAEVEYMDKESPAVDVKFTVVAENDASSKFITTGKDLGFGPISFVIWTTTPWTLPANEAVAIHPELTYVLLQYDAERLIVVQELADNVIKKYTQDENATATILGTASGKDLENLQLQHPFYAKQVPVILGDHVTTDAGTGCVHTAPAHGQEDYIVGLQYKLPINNPVDSGGCFYDDTPLVAKQFVFKANQVIIDELTSKQKLLAHSTLLHSYPHCWRHKTPLIFRATKQWFISMEKNGLRNQALEAIKKVKWIPDWGEARITSMISGRPDWCVSRQRTWGTPLALVVHKKTGAIHPDMANIIEKVAQAVEKDGMKAWFAMSVADLVPAADVEDFEKLNDTMDVWFDSGSVNYCVGEQREELTNPADLYLEGSDQHRGWFQSSLLTCMAAKGHAPYKQVLTHGFTVDAQGRKFSKSLGNGIAPDKVTKTLGADILRLWVAATDYKYDLHVSDEILKRTSDVYRRIRNTARFLLANLSGFDPRADQVAEHKLVELDRWIIQRAQQLQTEILQAYNDYQFHTIYQKVMIFCSEELGSFYLDVIKDRQYTCKAESVARRSAQTALYHIAEALVRWIAPILSFTAEEIWQNIPGERAESVFLSEFYKDFPKVSKESTMDDNYWQQILVVRAEVNKALETARNQDQIGSGLEAEITLYCKPELLAQLQQLEDELRFVLITSQASVAEYDSAPSSALETSIAELKLTVTKSAAEKCQRCWHRRTDVNSDAKYPGICSRCVTNIASNDGEQRVYA